jgi:hypothetical protein
VTNFPTGNCCRALGFLQLLLSRVSHLSNPRFSMSSSHVRVPLSLAPIACDHTLTTVTLPPSGSSPIGVSALAMSKCTSPRDSRYAESRRAPYALAFLVQLLVHTAITRDRSLAPSGFQDWRRQCAHTLSTRDFSMPQTTVLMNPRSPMSSQLLCASPPG